MRVFGSTTERIEQIARVQRGKICTAQLIPAGLRFAYPARAPTIAPARPAALRPGTR
jgi:hypothetical protein